VRARIILSGIVAMAGAVVGGCTTSSSRPQPGKTAQAEALSHYSLALLANSNSDSSGALQHFEAALKLDPHEPKLYEALTALALKLHNEDKAIHTAGAYAKRFQESDAAQLMPGRVYITLKQPENAEAAFQAAVKKLPHSPECVMALAQFYLTEKNCAGAIQTLRTALSVQPENTGILQLLGILYVESARDTADKTAGDKALHNGIIQFRKLLKIDPDNDTVRQQLGLVLLSTGEEAEGAEIFRQFYLKTPADIDAARQYLSILLLAKKFDEAIALSGELAKNTETSPDAWLQLLEESLPAEEHPRLIRYLEKIISGTPDAAEFYYARLAALYPETDADTAETILQAGLQRYPENARLKAVFGFLRVRQNRFDDAYLILNSVRYSGDGKNWLENTFFILNFVLAAQLSGHSGDAAEILAASGEKLPAVLAYYIRTLIAGNTSLTISNAVNLLEGTAARAPDAPAPFYYLMYLYADLKNYDSALKTAVRCEQLAAGRDEERFLDSGFYYRLGAINERLGKLNDAEAAFCSAIEAGDEDIRASARNYIAYMWAERGEKLDTGLELIQLALQHEPDSGAYIDTLGWIYFQLGRYSDALTELLRALEIESTDAVIWEHLGDTYFKLGDRTAAIQHWQKAVEIDPGNNAARRLEEHRQDDSVP